mmetsp:Transcript_74485/g.164658  ORF Transcript_74485/g.164658 Transcript_74485/m.164658 type:complete len:266 (-) Transcript_74485:984-1781(-)
MLHLVLLLILILTARLCGFVLLCIFLFHTLIRNLVFIRMVFLDDLVGLLPLLLLFLLLLFFRLLSLLRLLRLLLGRGCLVTLFGSLFLLLLLIELSLQFLLLLQGFLLCLLQCLRLLLGLLLCELLLLSLRLFGFEFGICQALLLLQHELLHVLLHNRRRLPDHHLGACLKPRGRPPGDHALALLLQEVGLHLHDDVIPVLNGGHGHNCTADAPVVHGGDAKTVLGLIVRGPSPRTEALRPPEPAGLSPSQDHSVTELGILRVLL